MNACPSSPRFCTHYPLFDGVLELHPLPDGRHWRTDAPFAYQSNPTIRVVVPVGFVTDLASIPRLFWNIFPPFGTYTGAAVVHDVLYSRHDIARPIADGIFLEAMETSGTGRFARYTLWFFVRCFGWMFYNRKRRANAVNAFD